MISRIKKIAISTCLFLFTFSGLLYSGEAGVMYSFDLEKGLLKDSLTEFADITGIKVLDPQDLVKKIKSGELKGTFSVKAGLERLLGDSGLGFDFIDRNEIVLSLKQNKIETEKVDDMIVKDKLVEDEHKYIPSTLSLDRDFLNASNATDIKSSTKYMAGVGAFKTPKRGQSAGYCIRGMGAGSNNGFGENRVVMTIDGERLPDHFNFGHDQSRPMISGRNNVEFDTIKVLDVVKGPRAVTEGNDAIAGVVAFRTYSPEDFVDETKKFYSGISHGYRSENRENKTSLTLAAKAGNISGMVIGTKTRGHEFETYSNSNDYHLSDHHQDGPDPQWIDGENILGKINIGNETHRLSLLAENYDYKYDNPGATDTVKRKRLSGEYRFSPMDMGIDELKIKVYQQKLDTTEDPNSRGNCSLNGKRTLGDFNQDINTVRTDLRGSFNTGRLSHGWSAGLEYRWEDISRMEWEADFENGQITSIEKKKFLPDMTTKTYGGYLQYSLKFPFGLSVIPSVRYEKWEYSADETEDYMETMPDNGHKLASLEMDNTSVSPKILIKQELTKNFEIYFSFASGAKNPPLSWITGMVRPGHAPILPGVDLEPEKTDNFEVGMAWYSNHLQANIAGYLNRYEDMFGLTLAKSPIMNQFGFLPYNLHEVDIYGVEANIRLTFLENWFLRCLYSYSEGTFKKQELPEGAYDFPYEDQSWMGINPHEMILGFGYESERFGGSIDWTMRGSVENEPWGINTPGYGVVDMNCWFKIKENMEVSAGLYNILDREYWDGIDLVEEEQSSLDFYKEFTQPGRNLAVKVKIHF